MQRLTGNICISACVSLPQYLTVHDDSPSSEDANVLQISIEIGELRSEAEELRAQVLTLQADRDAIATEKKKMEVTSYLKSADSAIFSFIYFNFSVIKMNNIEKIRAQEGLIEELEIAIEDCQSENDRLKEVRLSWYYDMI